MSDDPMRHIRRHYEITGHSFGGRSPYPISKSVGDTVLHPDGRVTPHPDLDRLSAALEADVQQAINKASNHCAFIPDADGLQRSLAGKGLRIVPDALLIACGYLITFGDKDTDLARTTHAQIEAYRSTAAPTPARSHAAEPVSDAGLLLVEFAECIADMVACRVEGDVLRFTQARDRLSQLHAELTHRLNTAPARTAGTETGGTK